MAALRSNLSSLMTQICCLISLALPLGIGIYLAVYVSCMLPQKTEAKAFKQMRIRVVDSRSQPMSGTHVECESLGITGVTDTFGEMVAKAIVTPYALCQVYTPKNARNGKHSSRPRLQQRLVHFEANHEAIQRNHFTFAALDP